MESNEEVIKQKLENNNVRLPPTFKLAQNFTKALVKHAADGFAKVTLEQLKARLEVCNSCGLRIKNRCSHPDCGCFLDKKAWWASEDCPDKKWPNLDENGV
jgi:hypothetical protein